MPATKRGVWEVPLASRDLTRALKRRQTASQGQELSASECRNSDKESSDPAQRPFLGALLCSISIPVVRVTAFLLTLASHPLTSAWGGDD
jgi:hypothetical protein